jgi:hypothetical protein
MVRVPSGRLSSFRVHPVIQTGFNGDPAFLTKNREKCYYQSVYRNESENIASVPKLNKGATAKAVAACCA